MDSRSEVNIEELSVAIFFQVYVAIHEVTPSFSVEDN